jgi:hypothetical protein
MGDATVSRVRLRDLTRLGRSRSGHDPQAARRPARALRAPNLRSHGITHLDGLIAGVVGEVWRLFRARFWRTLMIVALLLAPLELLIAVLDPNFTSLAPGWWVWVGFTSAITLVAFPWVLGALVHDVAEGDRMATKA